MASRSRYSRSTVGPDDIGDARYVERSNRSCDAVISRSTATTQNSGPADSLLSATTLVVRTSHGCFSALHMAQGAGAGAVFWQWGQQQRTDVLAA